MIQGAGRGGPFVGTEPHQADVNYLSYTAAKRYEQCPQLQLLHKTKKVTKAANEKPFFMGRVVHGAFERWLLDPRYSLVELIGPSWAAEDEPGMVAAGRLTWKGNEREEVWAQALKVAAQLEADAVRLGLTQMKVFPEAEWRVSLGHGIGMWAKVDIWAEHPSENVGYLVEMKSGTSYDKAQTEWYAAVIRALAIRTGFDPPRIFAVALRPAMETSVSIEEIPVAAMARQINRVVTLATDMANGDFDPTPGWYCSTCEGRNFCPDWMGKYGGITNVGQVSI